jgi:ribonuclease BN (tRNA processing enzyme)
MADGPKLAPVDKFVKLQLLPSTFEPDGAPSLRQHLSCMVIDDLVAIDAGSLAMAATPIQQKQVRDIVLTHAHLDHIAGLPLYLDDLFATLTEPVTVHATEEVIETLERDVFNWSVYPRFSDLSNENGPVLRYRPFAIGDRFTVRHLQFVSAEVNHKVPSSGFIVSDGQATVAISGDTAEIDGFWEAINATANVDAILVECAFPDELADLAEISHHLTPSSLRDELAKCRAGEGTRVYVVNMKPMYREQIVRQLSDMGMPNVRPLEVGKVYDLGSRRREAT